MALNNLCFGQDQAELVSEGFMLSGIEGAVFFDNTKQNWYFELSSDVNDSFSRINAGTKLQLLCSAALEKLCFDVNERAEPNYKIWGRITKYNGQNFIYPSFSFPLGKIDPSESEVVSEQTNNVKEKPEQQVGVNESEDAIVIPENVLEKLSSRKIVRTETVREQIDVQLDTIISGRRAVLEKTSDEDFVFVLESIGRNISNVSLKVLPSQALELAEQIQASVSEMVHFKISGLLTKYKGEQYLLLQKASRVYSYQNFAR
jgi:hypothetical protein